MEFLIPSKLGPKSSVSGGAISKNKKQRLVGSVDEQIEREMARVGVSQKPKDVSQVNTNLPASSSAVRSYLDPPPFQPRVRGFMSRREVQVQAEGELGVDMPQKKKRKTDGEEDITPYTMGGSSAFGVKSKSSEHHEKVLSKVVTDVILGFDDFKKNGLQHTQRRAGVDSIVVEPRNTLPRQLAQQNQPPQRSPVPPVSMFDAILASSANVTESEMIDANVKPARKKKTEVGSALAIPVEEMKKIMSSTELLRDVPVFASLIKKTKKAEDAKLQRKHESGPSLLRQKLMSSSNYVESARPVERFVPEMFKKYYEGKNTKIATRDLLRVDACVREGLRTFVARTSKTMSSVGINIQFDSTESSGLAGFHELQALNPQIQRRVNQTAHINVLSTEIVYFPFQPTYSSPGGPSVSTFAESIESAARFPIMSHPLPLRLASDVTSKEEGENKESFTHGYHVVSELEQFLPHEDETLTCVFFTSDGAACPKAALHYCLDMLGKRTEHYRRERGLMLKLMRNPEAAQPYRGNSMGGPKSANMPPKFIPIPRPIDSAARGMLPFVILCGAHFNHNSQGYALQTALEVLGIELAQYLSAQRRVCAALSKNRMTTTRKIAKEPEKFLPHPIYSTNVQLVAQLAKKRYKVYGCGKEYQHRLQNAVKLYPERKFDGCVDFDSLVTTAVRGESEIAANGLVCVRGDKIEEEIGVDDPMDIDFEGAGDSSDNCSRNGGAVALGNATPASSHESLVAIHAASMEVGPAGQGPRRDSHVNGVTGFDFIRNAEDEAQGKFGNAMMKSPTPEIPMPNPKRDPARSDSQRGIGFSDENGSAMVAAAGTGRRSNCDTNSESDIIGRGGIVMVGGDCSPVGMGSFPSNINAQTDVANREYAQAVDRFASVPGVVGDLRACYVGIMQSSGTRWTSSGNCAKSAVATVPAGLHHIENIHCGKNLYLRRHHLLTSGVMASVVVSLISNPSDCVMYIYEKDDLAGAVKEKNPLAVVIREVDKSLALVSKIENLPEPYEIAEAQEKHEAQVTGGVIGSSVFDPLEHFAADKLRYDLPRVRLACVLGLFAFLGSYQANHASRAKSEEEKFLDNFERCRDLEYDEIRPAQEALIREFLSEMPPRDVNKPSGLRMWWDLFKQKKSPQVVVDILDRASETREQTLRVTSRKVEMLNSYAQRCSAHNPGLETIAGRVGRTSMSKFHAEIEKNKRRADECRVDAGFALFQNRQRRYSVEDVLKTKKEDATIEAKENARSEENESRIRRSVELLKKVDCRGIDESFRMSEAIKEAALGHYDLTKNDIGHSTIARQMQEFAYNPLAKDALGACVPNTQYALPKPRARAEPKEGGSNIRIVLDLCCAFKSQQRYGLCSKSKDNSGRNTTNSKKPAAKTSAAAKAKPKAKSASLKGAPRSTKAATTKGTIAKPLGPIQNGGHYHDGAEGPAEGREGTLSAILKYGSGDAFEQHDVEGNIPDAVLELMLLQKQISTSMSHASKVLVLGIRNPGERGAKHYLVSYINAQHGARLLAGIGPLKFHAVGVATLLENRLTTPDKNAADAPVRNGNSMNPPPPSNSECKGGQCKYSLQYSPFRGNTVITPNPARPSEYSKSVLSLTVHHVIAASASSLQLDSGQKYEPSVAQLKSAEKESKRLGEQKEKKKKNGKKGMGPDIWGEYSDDGEAAAQKKAEKKWKRAAKGNRPQGRINKESEDEKGASSSDYSSGLDSDSSSDCSEEASDTDDAEAAGPMSERKKSAGDTYNAMPMWKRVVGEARIAFVNEMRAARKVRHDAVAKMFEIKERFGRLQAVPKKGHRYKKVLLHMPPAVTDAQRKTGIVQKGVGNWSYSVSYSLVNLLAQRAEWLARHCRISPDVTVQPSDELRASYESWIEEPRKDAMLVGASERDIGECSSMNAERWSWVQLSGTDPEVWDAPDPIWSRKSRAPAKPKPEKDQKNAKDAPKPRVPAKPRRATKARKGIANRDEDAAEESGNERLEDDSGDEDDDADANVDEPGSKEGYESGGEDEEEDDLLAG